MVTSILNRPIRCTVMQLEELLDSTQVQMNAYSYSSNVCTDERPEEAELFENDSESDLIQTTFVLRNDTRLLPLNARY